MEAIERIEKKLDKIAEFLEDSFLTKDEEELLDEIKEMVEKGELYKLRRIV